MCVVSMVMQTKTDEWSYRYFSPPFWINSPPLPPTPEEIREFRELLERARKYDREHNQPDCELAEKRQKLLDMAEELGIEIDFV